mmetsp:Transcript_5247/g.7994  ORF Transcript_5247/g.7994 Transcript_5247/m.7994 type:complete len:247 (+) Transcript_5247:755-1495(+)
MPPTAHHSATFRSRVLSSEFGKTPWRRSNFWQRCLSLPTTVICLKTIPSCLQHVRSYVRPSVTWSAPSNGPSMTPRATLPNTSAVPLTRQKRRLAKPGFRSISCIVFSRLPSNILRSPSLFSIFSTTTFPSVAIVLHFSFSLWPCAASTPNILTILLCIGSSPSMFSLIFSTSQILLHPIMHYTRFVVSLPSIESSFSLRLCVFTPIFMRAKLFPRYIQSRLSSVLSSMYCPFVLHLRFLLSLPFF